jgi:hypothetical protein
MGVIKNQSGSWFGLPDFGLTEKLSGNRTAQGGSNIIGGNSKAQTPSTPTSYPVTVEYAKPTTGGGGTGGNYNIPSTPTNNVNQGYQNIQQGQDAGNSQIESDYNNAISMLGGAEQSLRAQGDTASASIDQQFGSAKNEITNTQNVAQQGVSSTLATAEKTGATATQQARDLFRQTQQANNAQLSALGISSSSVSEALAERLGVETARRIAGVSGSVEEARVNASKELGRINEYYQGKVQSLQEQVAVQKSQIQNSLMQGLNQINSARNQAASDKASARANLLSQVQNQIYSLTQQQQQFEQSLQQWAQQKSAALTPIIEDQTYLQKLVDTANTLNQQFSPTGFAYTPEISYDKNGNMTGQVKSNKKTTDQLAELYQQAGVSK